MTLRVLVHVGIAAFGIFVGTLNALMAGPAAAYLVAGCTCGPAVARFLTDRRKLADGYYGQPPARRPTPGWCPPVEPPVSAESPRVTKLRRLADDPRTPAGERAAALAALQRLRGGVTA